MKPETMRLYLVTDSSRCTQEVFLNKVESALMGGVSIVQLREKEKTTREMISLAEKLHELTKKYGVPLIIDDRIDVAMAVGAEGVHLGQEDMPVSTARRLLGKDMIIGATTKTVEQALAAYNGGADYLGVGAIFPTTTKVKTVLTSTETLEKICKAVPIPVNAIGGLNEENIYVLKDIPISGICVVSAIMKADDSGKAASSLREKMITVLGL